MGTGRSRGLRPGKQQYVKEPPGTAHRHGGPALLQLVVFPMFNYPKLTMFEYQTIAGESFFSFLNRSA